MEEEIIYSLILSSIFGGIGGIIIGLISGMNKERLKGALFLIILEILPSIILAIILNEKLSRYSDRSLFSIIFLENFFLLSIGGAVAGAICGKNRVGIISAFVGSIIAMFLNLSPSLYFMPYQYMCLFLLMPSLGALIGLRIHKMKTKLVPKLNN